MSTVKLLTGSLSNDLFRTANLTFRDAKKGASRFLLEAKRWSEELEKSKTKKYIKKIAKEISQADTNNITIESAEKYLMYAVLLQNYTINIK